MRILIATDAWLPQVNGVVRTLSTTARSLEHLGHEVRIVEPALFRNFPCLIYPEIHLALPEDWQVRQLLRDFAPEAIHIATEGPIGLAVRRYCLRRRLRFSTSYHTKFPEYLKALMSFPLAISYRFMRWFHARSSAVMAATPTLADELRQHGFGSQIVHWSRGVDTRLFHPRRKSLLQRPRPILMYVGRLSREKNVEEFLRLETSGTKYLVGDGPVRQEMERKYPQAVFMGPLTGERLAQAYANADVVVFPSRTDTFGLVILEALASGVPVAAYPVPGPRDILEPPETGALHVDLATAVDKALRFADPDACVALARNYSWEKTTQQFLYNLVPVAPTCSHD